MAPRRLLRKRKTRAFTRRGARKLSMDETDQYIKRSRRWLERFDVEFREIQKTTERQKKELREMQERWEAFQEELNKMPPFRSKMNIPL